MTPSVHLIPRIALFAALIYVLSLGTTYLPNVNLIFFIVFLAGFMWGGVAGVCAGGIGMTLWTVFHPYGPAPVPIMIAQVIGVAVSGIIGTLFRRYDWHRAGPFHRSLLLVLSAVVSTMVFYIPVNVIDAWMFQPFWERFVAGMAWSLLSLASNAVIFPLLFPLMRPLYAREGIT